MTDIEEKLRRIQGALVDMEVEVIAAANRLSDLDGEISQLRCFVDEALDEAEGKGKAL